MVVANFNYIGKMGVIIRNFCLVANYIFVMYVCVCVCVCVPDILLHGTRNFIHI